MGCLMAAGLLGLGMSRLFWDCCSCWEARERMSLLMRYGRPKTASMKTRKGFFEGVGGALGF